MFTDTTPIIPFIYENEIWKAISEYDAFYMQESTY